MYITLKCISYFVYESNSTYKKGYVFMIEKKYIDTIIAHPISSSHHKVFCLIHESTASFEYMLRVNTTRNR